MDVGIGTDEKELILVLGHRNAQQRMEIRETYHQIYKESLVDRLQSELSGDFRVSHDVIVLLNFNMFLKARGFYEVMIRYTMQYRD